MEAFIGVTSEDWFDFHVNKGHNKAVFWTNRLINLQKGAKFLFLCGVGQKNRYIAGYGIVAEQGISTVKKLWDEFEELCGADSLDDLNHEISRETSNKLIDYLSEVSYWLLGEFTPFNQLVYANDVEGNGRKRLEVFPGDTKFPRNQQIGKKIEVAQADEIIKAGL